MDGYNNLTFASGTVLNLAVDWTHIPSTIIHIINILINIYYVKSNESVEYEWSDVYIVDTLDDATSKTPYLYPIGEWFKQRDDVIQHKRKFNLNVFFNKHGYDVFIR